MVILFFDCKFWKVLLLNFCEKKDDDNGSKVKLKKRVIEYDEMDILIMEVMFFNLGLFLLCDIVE